MSKWADLAQWRPTTHHGGAMNEYRGLVLHIAEGYYEGTIAWQKGDNGVSSHFVIGREHGEAAQLVDTGLTAWTQREGNGEWLSAEFAGFTPGNKLHKPGWEKLSPWQLEVAAKLLAKGHQQYRWPLQLATGRTGKGLGHHSMGGTSWGHRDCPGPAIIGQKPAILARAKQLAGEPEAKRPTVRAGDHGAVVREVQTRANLVPGTGRDVTVDGQFGPGTEAKVKRVQEHYHLDVDGIVGRQTWGRLGVTW